MEKKQIKMKSKILKILPKSVTAVTLTFQNPPFSPGRDHKTRQENATKLVRLHGGKGFSGPIVPMIPDEARRKPNDGGNGTGINYQEEPTSPKISCMGQIKHKKKRVKKDKARNVASNTSSSTSKDIVVKKHHHVTTFHRMLFHGGKPKSERRKSDASAPLYDDKDALEDRAPQLNQMKRFASGRDVFASFDWKAQVVSEETDYYSDEGRVQSDDEEEEQVIIPFSAPIVVGGVARGHGQGGMLDLKPRKEINLWRRRTMAPPRPLQLDPLN